MSDALPIAVPSVKLSVLLEQCALKAYVDLCELVELLPEIAPKDRRAMIMRYVHDTLGRFMRLAAIVRWAEKAGCTLSNWQGQLQSIQSHALLFETTANNLHAQSVFYQTCRLPMLPIVTAVDALVTQCHNRLPAGVMRLVPAARPTAAKLLAAVAHLDHHLRLRLIDTRLPSFLGVTRIEHGRLWLAAPGLFEMSVTISGPHPLAPWTLLEPLVLLAPGCFMDEVEERHHKAGSPSRLSVLKALIDSRLKSPGIRDPLFYVCNMLRTFCLQLGLADLAAQGAELARATWDMEDTFLAINTPGKRLSIAYWGSSFKSHVVIEVIHGVGVPGAVPSTTAEDDPPVLQLTHVPLLVDPSSQLPYCVMIGPNARLADLLQAAVSLHGKARLLQLETLIKSTSVWIQRCAPLSLEFCDGLRGRGELLVGFEDEPGALRDPVVMRVAFHRTNGSLICQPPPLIANGPAALEILKVQVWLKANSTSSQFNRASVENFVVILRRLGRAIVLDRVGDVASTLGFSALSRILLKEHTHSWTEGCIFLRFKHHPLFYLVGTLGANEDSLGRAEFELLQTTPLGCSDALLSLPVRVTPAARIAALTASAVAVGACLTTTSTSELDDSVSLRDTLLHLRNTCLSVFPALLLFQQLDDVRPPLHLAVEPVIPTVNRLGGAVVACVQLLAKIGALDASLSSLVHHTRFQVSAKSCDVIVTLHAGFPWLLINAEENPISLNVAENCVVFSYTSLTSCVADFFSDWNAAIRLFDFAVQLPAADSVECGGFKWPSNVTVKYTLTGIHFAIAGGGEHCAVVLRWSEARNAFYFEFRDNTHFEMIHEMLVVEVASSKNLHDLCVVLGAVSGPLVILTRLLTQQPGLSCVAQSCVEVRLGLKADASRKLGISVLFCRNDWVSLTVQSSGRAYQQLAYAITRLNVAEDRVRWSVPGTVDIDCATFAALLSGCTLTGLASSPILSVLQSCAIFDDVAAAVHTDDPATLSERFPATDASRFAVAVDKQCSLVFRLPFAVEADAGVPVVEWGNGFPALSPAHVAVLQLYAVQRVWADLALCAASTRHFVQLLRSPFLAHLIPLLALDIESQAQARVFKLHTVLPASFGAMSALRGQPLSCQESPQDHAAIVVLMVVRLPARGHCVGFVNIALCYSDAADSLSASLPNGTVPPFVATAIKSISQPPWSTRDATATAVVPMTTVGTRLERKVRLLVDYLDRRP